MPRLIFWLLKERATTPHAVVVFGVVRNFTWITLGGESHNKTNYYHSIHNQQAIVYVTIATRFVVKQTIIQTVT